MTLIHPTAVIHPSSQLGEDVRVGPYVIIGEHVILGDGCTVDSHASVHGFSTIGSNNHFFPYAAIGGQTQDLKYHGEETWLKIGDNNTFREFCTINRGTGHDKGITTIGSHNSFLAYSHVAHDCQIGDHVILSNNATLAGHVCVGNYAVLSGFSAVHQFGHIGAHAMIGAYCFCNQDIPAFTLIALKNGHAAPVSINKTGLKRRNFTAEKIQALEQAYKLLYRSQLKLDDSLDSIEALMNDDNKDVLSLFVTSIKLSTRGIKRR